MFWHTLLEKLAILLVTVGGLIVSLDFIGSKNLDKLEVNLRSQLKHLIFGDIYLSSICCVIWRALTLPFLIILFFSKKSSPIFNSRKKFFKEFDFENSKKRVVIDVGTSIDEWESYMGDTTVDINAYWHIHPDYNQLLKVGDVHPDLDLPIKRIILVAPGVITFEPGKPNEKIKPYASIFYIYVETLVRLPFSNNVITIPKNPLFTPLIDRQVEMAMSIIRNGIYSENEDVLDEMSLQKGKPISVPLQDQSVEDFIIDEYVNRRKKTFKKIKNIFTTVLGITFLLLKSLLFSIFGAAFSLIAALLIVIFEIAYQVVYFSLAIIYNVIILILAPFFFSIYSIIKAQLILAYKIAEKYEIEYGVKLLGLLPIIIGTAIQLIL